MIQGRALEERSQELTAPALSSGIPVLHIYALEQTECKFTAY